ncbi:uracil-DNA glycosylase [Candidatus Dojkabacteria bacterium]|uniref:Uracil-DNA glycosylase n=1 Tax=Candidatus Dojkabacteria bacterium TaxID=2099670 RepID=A0A955RHG6_9BACT|nr:uracil-DNA glycosylase [Candidatus Dojkabacteria bacterium]
MDIKIEDSWKMLLIDEFDKDYFKQLIDFVKSEYKSNTIYPPGKFIFRAFNEAAVDDVKVVILGQDPYHTPGVANGLAFSANSDQKIPPSLRNIYKELESDLGIKPPEDPDLTRWAKQGVLLLNATLTVEKGKAGSHQKKGWEEFTDEAIKRLSELTENLVFFLWGAYAQKKGEVIDKSKHLVIESAHPSPFSADRGFFGSKPFSKANAYLIEHKIEPIDW